MNDGTIDARTRVVALLGYPVDHSLSPLIHNTAFRSQRHNMVYVALPVAPGAVAPAVEGLRALGLAGANVTLPHKQAVLPLLDDLSEQARAVGAVNTIVCRREAAGVTLYGDNTDVVGFLAPLQPRSAVLQRCEMLLFGAGGAARAVAYALLTTFRPARLTLAVRTPAKAETLARDLAPYDSEGALHVAPLAEAAAAVRQATLLVNATPLGMHPDVEGTPWADASDVGEEQIAYDLVYTPETTRWLRDAAARGAETIGGMDMLLGQAAASYAQWTLTEMPLDVVRTAVRRHLGATS